MSEHIPFPAERRAEGGKGAARAVRRQGRVPAVLYGGKLAPELLSLERRLLVKRLEEPGFFTHVYDLMVDGKPLSALCRDIQFDPVTDVPIHVDFLRVSDETRIEVAVRVEFINGDKSPGLKAGGVLNIVRHEVDIYCRAGAIPDHLTVDLAGLEFNDSVHWSAIKVPEGVAPVIADRDFTICTIAPPSTEAEPTGGSTPAATA